MIPKTIHYCWFGRGEKPALARRCMASWKRYCPDYEIIEWNEDNFDVDRHPYLRWCYDRGKWAFLSDYARLIVLSERGGVYLDTDVELIRPLDELLSFDAYYGFETDRHINTGQGFGCVPHHPSVEAMRAVYEAFIPDESGAFPLAVCPRLNTEALLPYGLRPNGARQRVCGAQILPADYLNPYDDPTGRLRKTENTYSIHWYGKSWMSKALIARSRLTRPLHRALGTDFILFRLLRRAKDTK